MNKFILPLTLLILFSFTNKQPNTKTSSKKTTTISNGLYKVDNLYDLKINIETTKDNIQYLVVSIILKKDSYFVSPNDNNNFSGKFNLDLGNYQNVVFDGTIIETPLSIKKTNTNNITVNNINVNTVYKQKLAIGLNPDFEVFGRVQFTIEPRCTYEEIPFKIIYKNNKMTITEAIC